MYRRTFLQASAAVALPRFAIAETASTRTLRFVPQANLTLLDPIFTTDEQGNPLTFNPPPELLKKLRRYYRDSLPRRAEKLT